ncbi:MAG: hypothetical protein ACYTGL_05655 [Planctomycetota bacterium]|jgi:hypothetical protein
MRQRQDFYTLCPSCETRIPVTLASRLQAARSGSSCRCPSCSNEWICIQEWIYRDSPAQSLPQQVPVPNQYAPAPVVQPVYAVPIDPHPAHTQGPAQMPRPHMLPTYQPPQRVEQTPAAAQQQPEHASNSQIPQQAPAPHAWSFERQPQATSDVQPSQRRDQLDR